MGALTTTKDTLLDNAHATRSADARPLAGTLWHFACAGWVGYVDFMDGRYHTHWGEGRFALQGDEVRMTNGYDPYVHVLRVDFEKGEMRGMRNDGQPCAGSFITRYGR